MLSGGPALGSLASAGAEITLEPQAPKGEISWTKLCSPDGSARYTRGFQGIYVELTEEDSLVHQLLLGHNLEE